MKKILVAFDGAAYSKDSADFAIRIAKASDSLLVGVFLYDLEKLRLQRTYSTDVLYQFYYYDFSKLESIAEKNVQNSIREFKGHCEKAHVNFKVHLDKGVPLLELLKESPFADLIVIDSKTSFFSFTDEQVNTFLKDLLVESKCPVLIVPAKFEDIENAIIAYDGSESSVFAMKMFNYIFPEWTNLNTTVITVNRSSSNHVPKNRDIKDLAARHFKHVKYQVLNGKEEKQLLDFVRENKNNSIVVMGAYGRSTLSRIFHESLSNKLIGEVKVPLFIAHQ